MQAPLDNGGIMLRVEGDAQISKALGRLSNPAERTELMFHLATYGVMSTQQRFMDQKGPDGTAWKKSLRAEEAGGETLRMTNRLMSSFNAHSTASVAEWGTNVMYANIHQNGGIIIPRTKKALAFRLANGAFVAVKKVTMPARPFLGVDQTDRARLLGIATNWGKELMQ